MRVTADDGIDFLEHGEVLLTFAKDDPAGARLHAAVDALRRDIESRAELSVRRIRAKRGNGAYATGPQRARR